MKGPPVSVREIPVAARCVRVQCREYLKARLLGGRVGACCACGGNLGLLLMAKRRHYVLRWQCSFGAKVNNKSFKL